MECSELRDQLSGILSGILSKDLRNDIQGFAEFSNSGLFLSVQSSSVIFQMNAQGDFDCTTSWNNVSTFQSSLDNAKGIVQRSGIGRKYRLESNIVSDIFILPVDFLAHEFICTSNNNRSAVRSLHALKEDAIVISHSLLVDFITLTEVRSFEDFITLRSSKSCNNSSYVFKIDFLKMTLLGSKN